jgi:asparagine synthase (glutamine-hydrolysing)
MGALFGYVGGGPDTVIHDMGHCLRHRAPDIFIARPERHIALGVAHREPAAAIGQSGGLSIVCDAVLYNASELVARLAEKHAEPASTAPADILLALYRAFGLEGIELIDGDFAYVIIDPMGGEVVLGRDFFGCRPLYYSLLSGGRLAFASEYKALLALFDAKPEVDRDMVQHLQCTKRVVVGRTLLANVFEAMPGTAARMTPSGAVLASHSYPPLRVDVRITEEADAIRLIHRKLTEAVRRRSAGPDPIGLALSGGVDSIATAFLLRRIHPDKEIHTFTAGSGPDDPEIVVAAKVAARIGSRHHEIITPPDLLRSGLRDLVWHMEDPFSRSEALQLLELARVARDHVGVLLSAQGSDGLFGGMHKYMIFYLMQRLPIGRAGLREFFYLTQTSSPPQTRMGKVFERLYYKGEVPPAPRVKGARWPVPSELQAVQSEFVNINMAAGFQVGVCMDIHKFERTFAAAGLEYSSPFYDLDLVRSAYTITDKLKIRYGVQKYILRRALATIVDDEFRQLPKFPQRMKYDRAFAEVLDEVAGAALADDNVRRRGWFDPDDIRALFRPDRNRPYSAEAAMRLWTATLTEYWAQLFVDGRTAARVPNLETAATP